jgi:hypothetical protein
LGPQAFVPLTQATGKVMGMLVAVALAAGLLRLLAARLPALRQSRSRPSAAADRGTDARGRLDYRAVPVLVTASERAAWRAIADVRPAWVRAVCPKVRIEDFVAAGGEDRNDHWRLRGHVKSRHVDFLVVDAEWLPRLVIEIDGSSHERADRRRRDALVDAALASAGIPMLRLRHGDDWSVRLAEQFRSLERATRLPAPTAPSR